MDKLIELLNEYEWKELYFYDDWICCDKYDMYEVWDSLVELEIISKRYWFIQRLVDNDKIDLMKLKKWIEDNKFYCAKWGKTTNMLLMLLAIQEQPIDFLVSILK